ITGAELGVSSDSQPQVYASTVQMNLMDLAAIADSQPQAPVVHS
ncbi:hypothetical protein Tco_1408311, partial [Tanacetum coccineum]